MEIIRKTLVTVDVDDHFVIRQPLTATIHVADGCKTSQRFVNKVKTVGNERKKSIKNNENGKMFINSRYRVMLCFLLLSSALPPVCQFGLYNHNVSSSLKSKLKIQ